MAKDFDSKLRDLADEPIPPGLAERISRRLREERSTVAMGKRTPRGLVFGAAALLIGLIVMRPREAQAFGVLDVKRSLEEVRAYRILTYRIEDGRRTPVAETRLERGNLQVFLIDPQGRKRPLSEELDLLTKRLGESMGTMSPESLNKPGAWQSLFQRSIGNPEKLSGATGVAPQKIDVEQLRRQLLELTKELKNLTDQFQRLSQATQGGALMASGEANVRFTDRMLSDTNLWSRMPNVELDGHTLHHFALKGASPRFDLYIDPSTRLPYRTHLEFNFAAQTVVTESDYRYTR